MTSIICGKCSDTHSSVAAVRACYEGNLFPCHWLVERVHSWADAETGDCDSWTVVEDCGAEAIATDRGWTCAAGHEHVSAFARADEGWDYAEEYDEAKALAFAGVEPRTMDGHLVTSPADFALVGA